MNKFSIHSFQITETGKWRPSATLQLLEPNGIHIQEASFDQIFDTKEEADNFARVHFTSLGYIESDRMS